MTFWQEQKRYKKIWQGKLRWLTFTNRFDNHKLIWALSDKYHSDAKWFGKHNGIIHFCLNLIVKKAFISRSWRTILKSQSVLLFFIPPKCQVLVSTLTVLSVNSYKKISFRTTQIHKRRFPISAKEKNLLKDETPSFVYLCIPVRAKEITAWVQGPFRVTKKPIFVSNFVSGKRARN